MSAARIALRVLGIFVAVVLPLVAYAAWMTHHRVPAPRRTASRAARHLLVDAIGDDLADAEQVRRGQYLVRLGDCLSCHLAPDGEPFAGGLGLNTPFGVIYSANITSDKENGIGDWTSEQFYRAMHDGIGIHGERLYPAFPYPWFAHVSREDDDAILAFLKTIPASNATPPPNELPFPINQRKTLAGWDALFLHATPFTPDPTQSPEWNRGAAIVDGLGHCSGCHTPKNALGADKRKQAFYGGILDNHAAPDLTANERTGLGSWTLDDITEYLRTGRNAHANAGGPMADVIAYSTSLISEEDRHAIAVYLKALPARAADTVKAPDTGAMTRGAEVYADVCSACHLSNGVGQPRIFPPLEHDAVVQQPDPTGVLHIVLAGSRTGPSPSRPSALTMPSFAWKLSDQEIADVVTYIRNSWGNSAGSVSVGAVHDLRERLGLQDVHPTDSSEDRDRRDTP